VLDDAYGEIGDGRATHANTSAEIPLGIFTGIEISRTRETLLELTEEAVKRTLFDAMGVEGGSSEGSNGS